MSEKEIRAALTQLDALRSLPTLFLPLGFGLWVSPSWVGMLGKLHGGIWTGWEITTRPGWNFTSPCVVSMNLKLLLTMTVVLKDIWNCYSSKSVCYSSKSVYFICYSSEYPLSISIPKTARSQEVQGVCSHHTKNRHLPRKVLMVPSCFSPAVWK